MLMTCNGVLRENGGMKYWKKMVVGSKFLLLLDSQDI